MVSLHALHEDESGGLLGAHSKPVILAVYAKHIPFTVIGYGKRDFGGEYR